jgi:hypothetical protein
MTAASWLASQHSPFSARSWTRNGTPSGPLGASGSASPLAWIRTAATAVRSRPQPNRPQPSRAPGLVAITVRRWWANPRSFQHGLLPAGARGRQVRLEDQAGSRPRLIVDAEGVVVSRGRVAEIASRGRLATSPRPEERVAGIQCFVAHPEPRLPRCGRMPAFGGRRRAGPAHVAVVGLARSAQVTIEPRASTRRSSRLSGVQAFPSAVQVENSGPAQPSCSSQVSAHSGPPAQGSPACTLQLPPAHVSAPLQNKPSSQLLVCGRRSQVPVALPPIVVADCGVEALHRVSAGSS